jgi:phospholipase C
MESRSFDHLVGWLPNAEGKQVGLSFNDKNGKSHLTHSLSGDFTGCPQSDPDHSYNGSRVAYDGGKMDCFLRAASNDVYSIGYYEESDTPFFAALARNYTFVCVIAMVSLLKICQSEQASPPKYG